MSVGSTNIIFGNILAIGFSTNIVSPALGATVNNFIVYVNNVPIDIKVGFVYSAFAVSLELYATVYPQDNVTLSYLHTGSNLVFNSDTYYSFIQAQVLNSTAYYNPRPYFEVKDFIYGYNNTLPYSSFFENDLTDIYTSNNVILDRTPPLGNVLINESSTTGGVQVHSFAAFGDSIVGTSSSFSNICPLIYNYSAINFHSYAEQSIGSVSVGIAASGTFQNANNQLAMYVYPSISNVPAGSLIGISSTISYSSITSSVTLINFAFSNLTLSDGDYWFILTPFLGSVPPIGGTIYTHTGSQSNLFCDTFLASNDFSTWLDYSAVPYVSFANTSGIALPSVAYTQDALSNTLNSAFNFGGALNPNNVEIFGDGIARSIVQDLTSSLLVNFIQVGATANGVTEYIVEYSTPSNSNFVSLFSMTASQKSTPFYRFVFSEPQSIASVRIRSLGDFYYQDNNAVLTIAATDVLSQVTGVQLSRFSNFSDIVNINAFTSFNGGIVLQNWPIVLASSEYAWIGSRTQLKPRFIAAIYTNATVNYVIADKNKFYLFNTISQSLNNTPIFDLGDVMVTVTACAVISNKIYFGTSSGDLYRTADGSAYIKITASAPLVGPVLSITTFNAKIYVGIRNLNLSSNIRIYEFIETTPNVFTYSFSSWARSIQENTISGLSVGSGQMIIAAGDYTNNLIGTVYTFDGILLKQVFAANRTPQAFYYSGLDTTAYISVGLGEFYISQYDANNNLSVWNKVADINSATVNQIAPSSNSNYLIITSNDNLYVYDKINQVIVTSDPLPYESSSAYQGLYTIWYNYNLGTTYLYDGLASQRYYEFYGAVNFINAPVYVNASNLIAATNGYLVFSISDSHTIQLVYGLADVTVTLDGAVQILDSTGSFTAYFIASQPRSFSIQYQNILDTSPQLIMYIDGVVGTTQNMYPPIYPTAICNPTTINDVITTANREVLSFSVLGVLSYQKFVYARFQDSLGNTTSIQLPAQDYIYKNSQRSLFSDTTPSGALIEINTQQQLVSTFVPPEASTQLIYGPNKIVRAKAFFESQPFYARDVSSWGTLTILTELPTAIPIVGSDYGTQVIVYLRYADNALNLASASYTISATQSTINNQTDFGSIVSIQINLSPVIQKWIQYKIELLTATTAVTPVVHSALITYSGSNSSKFYSKTFDTSVHSSLVPPPTIRRGIFTANFAANGGSVQFGYTTSSDPTVDFSDYVVISPNVMFTLPQPSSTIKFGMLLLTGSTVSCIVDEWGAQLDTGPDDLTFMPPQALFGYSYSGVGNTIVNFNNKSTGQITGYLWNFGSSGIVGYPSDSASDPLINRANPVVGYPGSPVGVGVSLLVYGATQNNFTLVSEVYLKTLS